jgi:hypothetical protein
MGDYTRVGAAPDWMAQNTQLGHGLVIDTSSRQEALAIQSTFGCYGIEGVRRVKDSEGSAYKVFIPEGEYSHIILHAENIKESNLRMDLAIDFKLARDYVMLHDDISRLRG